MSSKVLEKEDQVDDDSSDCNDSKQWEENSMNPFQKEEHTDSVSQEVDINSDSSSEGEDKEPSESQSSKPAMRGKTKKTSARIAKKHQQALERKRSLREEEKVDGETDRRKRQKKLDSTTCSCSSGQKILFDDSKNVIQNLPKKEIDQFLRKARQKGLPSNWVDVRWHSKWKRRVLISPDKSRMFDSLPRAIAYSIEAGSVAAEPSSLPIDVEDSELYKELSPEKAQAVLRKAKAKGLPDNWRVVWNIKRSRRNWICPEGKIYGHFSLALEVANGKGYSTEKRKIYSWESLRYKNWKKRFTELKTYHKKHGTTLVPDSKGPDQQLGQWVKRQRYEYSARKKGKPSKITDERIQALESLEFVWSVPRKKYTFKNSNSSESEGKSLTMPHESEAEQGIFDNAPHEEQQQRNALFADTQPPAPQLGQEPINFVHLGNNRRIKSDIGGSEEYFQEVERYLRCWYGLGPEG